MKITDIRATTVTVPLEAPLLHANGAHWGRFVRTIVEVETDEGLVGLGEMGGGGESAENLFRAMKSYLAGRADEAGRVTPRYRITLASALDEATCRRVNLGFMDYRQFRREDYEADPDTLVVERAGRDLYLTS
jgi:L-alanine-DL-glutamate epimerase-like enolase superfamily enzyme